MQNGRAEVGRYQAPDPPDEPFPAIVHPVNSADLETEAREAVRQAFPKFSRIKTSQVYTCPPEVAARAIWDNASQSS